MPRDVIAGSESMSVCNFNKYRQLTLKMWATKLHFPNIVVIPLTTLAVSNIFNSSRWMMDENGILPLHFFPIIVIYISFSETSSVKIICQIKCTFFIFFINTCGGSSCIRSFLFPKGKFPDVDLLSQRIYLLQRLWRFLIEFQ